MIATIKVWKAIQEYKRQNPLNENMMDPIDDDDSTSSDTPVSNPDDNNFPAQFGIDDEVAVVDCDGVYQFDATVVAVRFTKSKVFYDVISHYDACVSRDMDSSFIKPQELSDFDIATLDEAVGTDKIYILEPYNGGKKDFDNREDFTGTLDGAKVASKELLTKLGADRVAIIDDRSRELVDVIFQGANPYAGTQLAPGQTWVSPNGREFTISSIEDGMVSVDGGYRDSTEYFILFLAEEGAELKK